MTTDLQARLAAFNETKAHFDKRQFSWGSVDCLKVARYHSIKMGHKPPRPPRYSSLAGAIRALKKMGVSTCDELLDNHFLKIPPAAAIVGDLLVSSGEDGMDAIMISAGRWIYGFHEDSDVLEFILPENIKSAYRL